MDVRKRQTSTASPAKPGGLPIVLAADREYLVDEAGKPPAHLQQWCVHCVRIRRRPCVIAMEVDTRFAMVFCGLAPHDFRAFFSAFAERLGNTQWMLMQALGVQTAPHLPMERFLRAHATFRLFQRRHLGVQAHMREVAWLLEDFSARMGRLPENNAECIHLEALANDTPRTSKHFKGCIFPVEEMLKAWCETFAGFTPEEAAALQTRSRMVKRKASLQNLDTGFMP